MTIIQELLDILLLYVYTIKDPILIRKIFIFRQLLLFQHIRETRSSTDFSYNSDDDYTIL